MNTHTNDRSPDLSFSSPTYLEPRQLIAQSTKRPCLQMKRKQKQVSIAHHPLLVQNSNPPSMNSRIHEVSENLVTSLDPQPSIHPLAHPHRPIPFQLPFLRIRPSALPRSQKKDVPTTAQDQGSKLPSGRSGRDEDVFRSEVGSSGEGRD